MSRARSLGSRGRYSGCMRVAAAVFAGLVGFAPAQKAPAAPVPVRDDICRYIDVRALDAYDAGLDVAALPMRRAPARFADMLSRWWTDRNATSRPRPVEASGSVLHAHGAPEVVQTTEKAFAQLLAVDEVVRARVHCSVLTLPRAAAPEGLKPGLSETADEALVTRLVRVAAAEGGKLRNLPEVVAAPLRPFAIEDAPESDAMPLRLRAELVPLGRSEALLGLHVVRGALPANLANVPEAGKALASPVLRLSTGGLAVVAMREGEATTVVVVRCAELGPAVAEPEPRSAAPRLRHQ